MKFSIIVPTLNNLNYLKILISSIEKNSTFEHEIIVHVNQNLDEGPIIEQDVEKVDHELSPNDLVTIGKDIEARVLYKAIKNFSEGRVFLNGKKTIVFKGDKIL